MTLKPGMMTSARHVRQGVGDQPVLRSRAMPIGARTDEDPDAPQDKDVKNETTASYGIPVPYRIKVRGLKHGKKVYQSQ